MPAKHPPAPEPHPAASLRGSYFWMDVLRLVAAALVAASHVRDLLLQTAGAAGALSPTWKVFYFLTGFGHEAVLIFFVLSGFWIASSVDRRIGDEGFWGKYLIDRITRLHLVLLPALILGGLIDWLAIHVLDTAYYSGTSGALSLARPVAPHLSLLGFVGNSFFLQGIFVPVFGSNGPLWSLAFEFWFYIWFPALLLLLRYRRLSPALLSLVLIVPLPSMLIGFGIWLMGAALYYLDRWALERARPRQTAVLGYLGLAVSSTILGAALSLSRLKFPYFDNGLIVGLSFAGFIWAVLRADPPRLHCCRWLARYGAGASFSLYAFHFPLVALMASLLPPHHPSMPTITRLVEFVLVMVILLAVGWLLSRLTEANTSRVRAILRHKLIDNTGQRSPG